MNSRAGTSVDAVLVATQDEVAKAISTSRETVNRYLQELQRKSLLAVHRGQIDIPEIEALQAELDSFPA